MLVSLLCGCVSSQSPVFTGSSDFQVLGKLAVQAPEGNFSARFRWIQAGDAYDLELWGPFGQGRRRLTGNHHELSLLDGQGKLLLRGPPGEVMQRQLGFEVPLGALAFWIQGQPDPVQAETQLRLNERGEVTAFQQAGWHVAYPAYIEAGSLPGSDRRLPKRVEAENSRYRVRLAISRWEV